MEGWWAMLSEERHVDKADKKSHGDPRLRPDIVGLVMWIRALRSVLFLEKKDEEEKVKRGAEMVIAVWKNADLKIDDEDWNDANHKLIMWAPVWHGIKMARQVLGENTPLGRNLDGLITADLEPMLSRAREIVSQYAGEGTKRRGLNLYDELSRIPS
ncbi:MAG: hypothetical protein Q9216_007257 [Gyalolechia sp. 2 TL-2023]